MDEDGRPLRADRGTPEDRGVAPALRLDLDRLRPHYEMRSVTEYLTGIQSMRGDTSSLLFVRGADLETLADREGAPVTSLLDRFEQLGVVVGSN